MKRLVIYPVIFVFGVSSGILLCRYVSSVWSYNEAIRSRESLVDASVSEYRDGRFAEAAVLMEQANRIAKRPDQAWPVLFPLHAAVLRVTGVFHDIHVSDEYRAPETAYLFHQAGQDERARSYYDRLEKRRGRTPEQINASASAFLREAASFQGQQGEN